MDLLHLVDRLEELVAGAQKMPIGNRAIIDRRRMLDLIDQMRIAIPHEVREAQEIVARRETVRREAEEEGRILVAQAEEHASRLVEAHEITEAARSRAQEIAAEAERRLEGRIDEANRDIQARIRDSRQIAREQMEAADEYARELLVRLDHQLQAFAKSIRAGIQQLEPSHGVQFRNDDLPPLDDHDEPAPAALRAEPAPAAVSAAGRAETGAAAPAGPVERDEDGFENLLRRPSQPAAAPAVEPAEPGVIDDFEHEPLDDDPVLRPRNWDGGDEDER
jgi:hypothetical protein